MATVYITSTGFPAVDGATFLAAIAAATTGDTIEFTDSATYEYAATGSLASKALTIQGATGQLPVLQPVGGAGAFSALTLPGAGSVFRRLKLNGWALATNPTTTGGAINGNNVAITVDSCTFTGCGRALQYLGANSVVGAFRIYQCDQAALTFTSTAFLLGYAQTILNGVAFDRSGGNSNFFAFVSVYQTAAPGSNQAISAGSTSIVRNCAAKRSAVGGATAFIGIVDHCVQTGYTNTVQGTDAGNNVNADPLFTTPAANPPNFALQGGSPCLVAGVAVYGVSVDIDGNPRANPPDVGAYESTAPTTITGALGASTGPTTSQITLTLARAIGSDDGSFSNVANYTVTPVGMGGVTVSVTSAALATATTIVLATSEQTTGIEYSVDYADLNGVVDGAENFTGAGAAPTVSSAALTAGNVLRVTFSEDMAHGSEITDAANYGVTGAVVASVAWVNATHVDVTLAARIPSDTSEVFVTGPPDLANNPIDSSAEFAVQFLTLVPPGIVGDDRQSVAVAFNLTPTSGTDAVTDWTVEPVGNLGAEVAILAVDRDDVDVTLTLWPALSIGASYVITPVNAANAAGPVG